MTETLSPWQNMQLFASEKEMRGGVPPGFPERLVHVWLRNALRVLDFFFFFFFFFFITLKPRVE